MKKNNNTKSLKATRRSKIRKIRKVLRSIQGFSFVAALLFASGVSRMPSGDPNILDCILLLICCGIGFITSYILGDTQ